MEKNYVLLFARYYLDDDDDDDDEHDDDDHGTIHVPLYYVQPIYLLFYTLLWVSEGHRFLERTKYASSGVFLSS